MISVCIPVFNYRIGELLRELRQQAAHAGLAVEIIVIDDASDADILEENYRGKHLADQFISLETNIGRSRIRNLFLRYVTNDYCLFLDCDVMPATKNFLLMYAGQLKESQPVIYGGRIFPTNPPQQKQQLRWKYGTLLESNPAAVREQYPYRYFHSNNFLIKRSILERIRFDESLTGYGYEDSLFSYHLQKQGVPIKHIENPVIHLHLEETAQFLGNIDQSIVNLSMIQSKYDLSEIVRLVKIARRYRWLIKLIPKNTTKRLRNQLLKGSLNLQSLQLYKLLAYGQSAGNKS